MNQVLQNFKSEKGAALVYVLFLMVLVGIVGTVMLLSVTQSKRSLVSQQQVLAFQYKAEGALDLATHNLLERSEEEILNLSNETQNYVINGESISILIEKRYESSQQAEVLLQALNASNKVYRSIWFVYDYEDDPCEETPCPPDPGPGPGPGPGPTEPLPGDVPFVRIGDTVIGICIVQAHCGHLRHISTVRNIGNPPVDDLGMTEPPDYIGIPQAAGEVVYRGGARNPVNYTAKEGITIGAGMTFISAQNGFTFTALNGYVDVGGATLKVSNHSDITITANTYVNAKNTVFELGRVSSRINITANSYVDLTGAQVSPNRPINVCPASTEVRGAAGLTISRICP